jgi:hypothetical protein
MPVIPALMRLRQEDHEFQAIMSYISRSLCLKKNAKEKLLPSYIIILFLYKFENDVVANYC